MTRIRLDAKDVRVGDRVVLHGHLSERELLVTHVRVAGIGNIALAVVGRAGRREPALYRKPHELVVVEREDETA